MLKCPGVKSHDVSNLLLKVSITTQMEGIGREREKIWQKVNSCWIWMESMWMCIVLVIKLSYVYENF